MEATLERPWCTISGCDVVIVPRAHADVVGDRRLQDALHLERTTMQLLGDTPEEIERDLAETLDRSSFALAYSPSGELLGAVRFMLGGTDGVKSLWDVDRLAPTPPHPALARPEQLIDAMALSPAFASGRPPAELADVLLGACTCVGGAVFRAGRARHVTAHLHRRLLRHAARAGYPSEPFVPDDHPANGDFVPIVASLAELDHLVRRAAPGTHLAGIRPEYLRACASVGSLGTEDW